MEKWLRDRDEWLRYQAARNHMSVDVLTKWQFDYWLKVFAYLKTADLNDWREDRIKAKLVAALGRIPPGMSARIDKMIATALDHKRVQAELRKNAPSMRAMTPELQDIIRYHQDQQFIADWYIWYDMEGMWNILSLGAKGNVPGLGENNVEPPSYPSRGNRLGRGGVPGDGLSRSQRARLDAEEAMRREDALLSKHDKEFAQRTRTVGHHSIPRQILKQLPENVRNHPDVRGRPGNPNIRQIPEELHDKIHPRYNRRFDEEIMKRGGYQRVSPKDLNEIRDQLMREECGQ